MSSEEILLVVSLSLSAFFSGSETAYTVAGRLAMEVYRRHGRRGAKTAGRLYSNPTLLFNTTLVGNNLVAVLYASVAAVWLVNVGVPVEWIFVISPTILLIFGEILPKTLARETAERWALFVGAPLWGFRLLFAPLIVITRGASALLLRALGMKERETPFSEVSLGDLKGVWGQLHREGALDREEIELLDHAVALRDVKLREIMTPRTEVVGLPVDATVAEAETLARERGVTRFPVYQDSLDNIVGILNALDLIRKPGGIRDLMRPAHFVPEQAYAVRFLGLFRRGETGMVVVIDEHGGTAGVVTLEDLIERLVGEIEDEHDFRTLTGRVVSTDAWLVSGRASQRALADTWGIRLPEGEYDTVAGWILEELGRIPEPGESIDSNGWRVRVVAADRRRIKRVLIRKRRPRERRGASAVR
ncbi:MAG: hypothetical protein MAG453_00260 [Calditrichaeota bacterium]|nr:hypothetical protein [Calditrichota bacterium]